jgi:hypothetical protein
MVKIDEAYSLPFWPSKPIQVPSVTTYLFESEFSVLFHQNQSEEQTKNGTTCLSLSRKRRVEYKCRFLASNSRFCITD